MTKHTIPVTAIIEHNGKFLFMQRPDKEKNFGGRWVFPGGKVEAGEDIIEAVIREAEEETGLEFTGEIAFLSAYQFSRSEDDSSSQGLVFMLKSKNDKLNPNEEIADYKWIFPHEIVKYKDKTIYGMEVHVRNAVIALRKNMFLNYNLFTVSKYQKNNCKMDADYFSKLENEDLDDFLIKENILPR